MNNEKQFIYGITLSDYEIDNYRKESIKKEYGLTDKQIKQLKMAHLFRLSNNIKFQQFDADIVLFNEDGETYYHTGDFEPIKRVDYDEVVALVDNNMEVELTNNKPKDLTDWNKLSDVLCRLAQNKDANIKRHAQGLLKALKL